MSHPLFRPDKIEYSNATSANASDVVCGASVPVSPSTTNHTSSGLRSESSGAFASAWILNRTVPVYLALFVFPLLNFKSPTVFTKFNCLGMLRLLLFYNSGLFIVTSFAPAKS